MIFSNISFDCRKRDCIYKKNKNNTISILINSKGPVPSIKGRNFSKYRNVTKRWEGVQPPPKASSPLPGTPAAWYICKKKIRQTKPMSHVETSKLPFQGLTSRRLICNLRDGPESALKSILKQTVLRLKRCETNTWELLATSYGLPPKYPYFILAHNL